MWKKVKTAIFAAAVLNSAALASDAGVETVLEESAIRALLTGKTFHYELLGGPRGEEHHFADGKVVWRLPSGQCYYGVWVASGPMLCYYYGALRYGCWSVVRGADRYRHEPLDLNGEPGSGPPVHINRISEEEVECAPQQLSMGQGPQRLG